MAIVVSVYDFAPDASGGDGLVLEEVDDDGGFVAVPITTTLLPEQAPHTWVVRLTPSGLLAPNRTYRVADTLSGTSGVSFATGADVVDAAPASPSGILATIRPLPNNQELPCAPNQRYVDFIAPDAGSPLKYTFSEDASVIASFESLTAIYSCGAALGLPAWTIEPGPHTFEVRAVGTSGLSSTPVSVSFVADCAPPDGGELDSSNDAFADGAAITTGDGAATTADADAGQSAAAGPSAAGSRNQELSAGGGCTVGSEDFGASAAIVTIALAFVARTRARRRGRVR